MKEMSVDALSIVQKWSLGRLYRRMVEVPNGNFFGTHLVRCGHCLGDFDITITELHVDSRSSDYQPGIQHPRRNTDFLQLTIDS
ncbi:hypothetical protein QJS10_CPA10g01733 [Acorus calamus]|uniref:Uncharacterized protein n=1 Tax=Acorus calamus TaxID=4465 RepID=A0AAV9DWA5_ACOCL|nr:hypothetical protein QJS10_CPA10g01733 [Acorus calamus]